MFAEGTNTDASLSIEMIFFLNNTIIVIKAVNTSCQHKPLIVRDDPVIIRNISKLYILTKYMLIFKFQFVLYYAYFCSLIQRAPIAISI